MKINQILVLVLAIAIPLLAAVSPWLALARGDPVRRRIWVRRYYLLTGFVMIALVAASGAHPVVILLFGGTLFFGLIGYARANICIRCGRLFHSGSKPPTKCPRCGALQVERDNSMNAAAK
jgi:hypothetical protein